MGYLEAGRWRPEDAVPSSDTGEFVRVTSTFRNRIEAGGAHPPESQRYHLYLSLACPWAHRTLIGRKLKGLEEHIGVSVVHPLSGKEGWSFENSDGTALCTGDLVLGKQNLHEVYTTAASNFTGRVTVPVLWDKVAGTAVNNESSEILRMLNSAFGELAAADVELYPEPQRQAIDRVNEVVYTNINNGVYRCGFARTQEAYEHAFRALFSTLDALEGRLGLKRCLVGDEPTEADWRLFVTLIRFDAVYYTHFKCNLRRIADYPNLSRYLRDLYEVPGIAETVSLDHIKRHYFGSHRVLNPSGIVPIGPERPF